MPAASMMILVQRAGLLLGDDVGRGHLAHFVPGVRFAMGDMIQAGSYLSKVQGRRFSFRAMPAARLVFFSADRHHWPMPAPWSRLAGALVAILFAANTLGLVFPYACPQAQVGQVVALTVPASGHTHQKHSGGHSPHGQHHDHSGCCIGHCCSAARMALPSTSGGPTLAASRVGHVDAPRLTSFVPEVGEHRQPPALGPPLQG
jgi:hypothetical protein